MALRFIATRMTIGVVTVVALSMLVFAAIEVLPGDAAVYAVAGPDPSRELLDQTRERLGLDEPATDRYVDWLTGVFSGDLGTSLVGGEPVSAIIRDRLPNTLILGGLTLVLMVPLALALGIVSGTREGRRADRVGSALTLALVAIPEFVLGALLIVIFALVLAVLPAASLIPAGESPLAHPDALVLPVLTLTLAVGSAASRQVRAGVADVMRTRYVELARLRGLPERTVIRRHVLPNAIGPSLQILASSVGLIVGGSVIVEALFSYPGLGSALANAVTTQNFPVVEGIVMLLGAVLVVAYTLADLAIVLLNPKLRSSR